MSTCQLMKNKRERERGVSIATSQKLLQSLKWVEGMLFYHKWHSEKKSSEGACNSSSQISCRLVTHCHWAMWYHLMRYLLSLSCRCLCSSPLLHVHTFLRIIQADRKVCSQHHRLVCTCIRSQRKHKSYCCALSSLPSVMFIPHLPAFHQINRLMKKDTWG